MDGSDRSLETCSSVELNPLEWTLWAYLGLAALYAAAIDERSRQQKALKAWNKSVERSFGRRKSTLDLWQDSLARRAEANLRKEVADCDSRGLSPEMVAELASITAEKRLRRGRDAYEVGAPHGGGGQGYIAAVEALNSGRFDESVATLSSYLYGTAIRAIGNAVKSEGNAFQSRSGVRSICMPLDGLDHYARPARDNTVEAIAKEVGISAEFHMPPPAFDSVLVENNLWGLSAKSALDLADERFKKANISDVDAQIYLDYYYRDFGQSEIAKKYGMAQSTVSSRLEKVRIRLAELP